MGLNYQHHADLGGLTREQIMAARDADAEAIRLRWDGERYLAERRDRHVAAAVQLDRSISDLQRAQQERQIKESHHP